MNGMKVKAIRCFLGESMEKFSKRIGVGASTICAIENDQREMSGLVRGKLVRIESELPAEFLSFYVKFKQSQ